MFREHGIPVICADELAHEAVACDSPALEKIRDIFGPDVFDENGELDRAALGSRVFSDPGLRKELEKVVHPVVEQKKDDLLEYYSGQGHLMAVLDVPLLFEANWDEKVDVILVVYVSRDIQAARLVSRNGLSDEETMARLNSQWSIEDKKKKAHILIDNSGSIDDTRVRFAQALEELRSMASSLGNRKSR